MSNIKDILQRIEETNHVDDSWMDLKCRLTDCAEEITKLRDIISEMQQIDDVLAPHSYRMPLVIDCRTCANKGVVNGLSQETFCKSCIHGTPWKRNHYEAMRGEK